MPWLSITLELAAAEAEAFSDALIEAGAESVALDPVGPLTRLSALAPRDADAAALVAAAAKSAALAAPRFDVAAVADEDWLRRSREAFTPIRIGERLWIVPSLCAPPDPGAVVLRIDPGLAFGTGSHPSTRLALNYLEKNIRGNERVLDYGCGSGILAIAAARLGAGEVLALDLDPQALSAAADNARANGVQIGVASVESAPAGTYDLVLANILAGTLIALEPLLAARTRAGGRVLLSGILETQCAEVSAAFAAGFSTAIVATEEGWALVEGRRR